MFCSYYTSRECRRVAASELLAMGEKRALIVRLAYRYPFIHSFSKYYKVLCVLALWIMQAIKPGKN